jgi:flagellar basal-body rod protein FlgB
VDLSKVTIFGLANKRMAYLSERQKVLSENVANANTPGYSTKDLKPMDFRNLLRAQSHMEPATTNPLHLVGTVPATSFTEAKVDKSQVYEASPDGNSVSLEQQMIKVADTQTQYQLSANLYQKHLAMLKTALGHN